MTAAVASRSRHRRRAGQNTVLIIDEAQNLDPPTLEQIRLLSNFETPRDKLLQIMLIGQPELKARLNLPELRQLKQRIGIRCAIPSLTPDEARDYIRFRLRTAGARDAGLFTDRAIARINDYAKGIPRVINLAGDHCLLIGYADQRRRIEPDIVEQAIAYLEGDDAEDQETSRARWWTRPGRPAWAIGTGVAVAALALTTLGFSACGLPDVSTAVTTYVSAVARSVRDLVVR